MREGERKKNTNCAILTLELEAVVGQNTGRTTRRTGRNLAFGGDLPPRRRRFARRSAHSLNL